MDSSSEDELYLSHELYLNDEVREDLKESIKLQKEDRQKCKRLKAELYIIQFGFKNIEDPNVTRAKFFKANIEIPETINELIKNIKKHGAKSCYINEWGEEVSKRTLEVIDLQDLIKRRDIFQRNYMRFSMQSKK